MQSCYRLPKLPAEIRQIIRSYALTHIPPRNLTINDYLHESDRSLLNHVFLSKGGGSFPRIPVILDSDVVLKVETDVPSLLQWRGIIRRLFLFGLIVSETVLTFVIMVLLMFCFIFGAG